MTAADKVLAMLAYTDMHLNDGPQLVAILAFAAKLSPAKVTGALRTLERQGLVEKVRRGGQGDILWGLTTEGRKLGLAKVTKMMELEENDSANR